MRHATLGAVLLLVTLTSTAFAQAARPGTLRVTVVDPSGAVIVGATVAVTGATETLQPRLAQLANKTASAADRVTEVMPDHETRDQLLLGTAALAVAAAIGVSYQRRSGERHQ